MTKSEIINQLTQEYGDLPKDVISQMVQIILDEISNELAKQGRVEIRGFGAFSLRKRSARITKNPKTEKISMVSERMSVYFRCGKDFFDMLNGEGAN